MSRFGHRRAHKHAGTNVREIYQVQCSVQHFMSSRRLSLVTDNRASTQVFKSQAGLIEQKSWLAKSVPQVIYRAENLRSTNNLHFEPALARNIQQHDSEKDS